jgi:glycosyltransferase involved in cell wall biosynthesis
MSLSVVVLTRNEEKHIRDCLLSVRDWADELVVLDSHSTDRTIERAREVGARIEFRAFDNYPNQRNAALELARGDWIFFIDADERATPAVGQEIQSAIHNSPFVGFWIPRRNIIFGKEIRFTGWSPDYQPRVLKKGFARFDPAREVHELVLWDGQAGHLREPLIHYNYETLAQFHTKQVKYTRYEAQVWYAEGKRARWRGALGQPVREFFRRYIALQGWRDGGHGLLLSALMAYYAFVRWKMLRELSTRT